MCLYLGAPDFKGHAGSGAVAHFRSEEVGVGILLVAS